MTLPTFAAIDFETADHGSDSACAVGLVLVRNGRLEDRFCALIRPPRRRVLFTQYHGLTWSLLRDQAAFEEVWPRAVPLVESADFLVAHNASFDRRVLYGCCDACALSRPFHRMYCTVQLSRRTWPGEPSYRLPDICRSVGIPFDRHHEADADAEACARLMLAIVGRHGGAVPGLRTASS